LTSTSFTLPPLALDTVTTTDPERIRKPMKTMATPKVSAAMAKRIRREPAANGGGGMESTSGAIDELFGRIGSFPGVVRCGALENAGTRAGGGSGRTP
jgi:hypothetical protein